MRPDAIRVNPDDREDLLAPRSRIDYGKVYTIQHNIKVQPYGHVHPASMAALRHQFLNVWLGEAGAGAVAQSLNEPGPSNTNEAAQASQRRPSRRESHSTQPASGKSAGAKGSVTVADAREAQARAQVQRLMQAGRTKDQAIEIVRAAARQHQQQQQRQSSSKAQSSADANDPENESFSSASSDDESRVSGPSAERGRDRSRDRSPLGRGAPSGQRLQHPARVDSRPREQRPPPRQVGASIPSNIPAMPATQVQSRQLAPTASGGSQQQPRPSIPAPTGLLRDTRQTRPQQSQQPTSTSASTREAVERLIERGYTREQAVQYVAASLARSRAGQQ